MRMRAFVGNLEADAPLHPAIAIAAARPPSLQDAEGVVNDLLRLLLLCLPITRASRGSRKGGEELTRDPRPLEEGVGAIEGAAAASSTRRRRGWHGGVFLYGGGALV